MEWDSPARAPVMRRMTAVLPVFSPLHHHAAPVRIWGAVWVGAAAPELTVMKLDLAQLRGRNRWRCVSSTCARLSFARILLRCTLERYLVVLSYMPFLYRLLMVLRYSVSLLAAVMDLQCCYIERRQPYIAQIVSWHPTWYATRPPTPRSRRVTLTAAAAVMRPAAALYLANASSPRRRHLQRGGRVVRPPVAAPASRVPPCPMQGTGSISRDRLGEHPRSAASRRAP
ncbi:hypothetical protein C8Q77DRAFT_367950 [Trametes polyzona]|nr:hypothetical protein C8Q77DRAFT_367950 [Trametes polyzona]